MRQLLYELLPRLLHVQSLRHQLLEAVHEGASLLTLHAAHSLRHLQRMRRHLTRQRRVLLFRSV